MKRLFVSRVQSILAPEAHNKEIAVMMAAASQLRAKDLTLGGSLPEPDTVPTGADRLIWGDATNES